MNNDFLPPKRPTQDIRPVQPPQTPSIAGPESQALLEQLEPLHLLEGPKRRSRTKTILWVLGGLLLLALIVAASLVAWYNIQISPLSAGSTGKQRVQVVAGSSPNEIGQLLEEKRVIRSSLAFDIYTRLSGTKDKLQAGTYSLSPSESTKQIVDHLVSGKTDELVITFLPGATLAQDRAALIESGYSEREVDAALTKTYDHPLFAEKPVTADLEGYIYGETYHFDSSATVEQILTRAFDEFYSVVQDNDLVAGFKKQGLNLYEGITLASIIQREVSGTTDQKQVAQVFYTRLAQDMPLGSDVTYQYAAKKLGVTPSPSLESPYNTRKYPGLPPGPIATPGLGALLAVASPAAGDFVFFLSGDDDKTYFSRTSEEHEANIRNHCQVKCSVL